MSPTPIIADEGHQLRQEQIERASTSVFRFARLPGRLEPYCPGCLYGFDHFINLEREDTDEGTCPTCGKHYRDVFQGS